MIEVEHVSKRYGATLAVDDVSFSIGAGDVVGFLGPNGAGKSTLLKVISTWLPPSAGTVRVAGHDVRTDPLGVRQNLGYLPEHNALYEGMAVARFLDFVARMRGLSGARLKERMAWVVDRCQLEDVWSKRIQECSKGYRQRIGLAAAIVHDPPVVLLDEPTHGLDPLQVQGFLAFVKEMSEGRAILFSSHVLSEVVNISKRLLVINQGQLLFDGALDDLRGVGSNLEDAVLEIVRGGSNGNSAEVIA
ncbi:MAG: ABC-2 type transport system ATP-binding protein [Planctomycetota bacterium]|jgi:ABC-2 type transport system ATP-binding protein